MTKKFRYKASGLFIESCVVGSLDENYFHALVFDHPDIMCNDGLEALEWMPAGSTKGSGAYYDRVVFHRLYTLQQVLDIEDYHSRD